MKTTKIAAMAVAVAALMIIPVALYTVGDDTSSAGPIDYLNAPDINYDKLEELVSSEAFRDPSPDPSEEVVNTKELNSGEYMCMEKDFEFAKDATVTFNAGSSMTFYPAQAFSITSAADGYAALIFKEGSHIYVTSDNGAPTADNIITDIPIEKDTAFYLNGKVSYLKGKFFDLGVVIAAGSSIYDSLDAETRDVMVDFITENKVTVKAIVTVDSRATVVSADVRINADYRTPMGDAYHATVNGSAAYKVDVTVPAEGSDIKDLTVAIKGSGEFKANADVFYTATLKNESDLTYKVLDYDTANAKATMSGSVNTDVTTTDIDNEKVSSDPETYVTIKGNSASMALNFDNADITADITAKVDKYQYTKVGETGDSTFMLENFRFSGSYTGILETKKDTSPFTWILDLFKEKSSTVIDEYMNGVKDLNSSDEIKRYASQFFLGKFDETSGVVPEGVTSKSLKGEASIQRMEFSKFDIEGIDLSLEISESVGVKISASLSKFKMDSIDLFILVIPKIYVGTTNITLSTATDVENKAMFTVDLSTSIESKGYNSGAFGDGMLNSEQYVKNMRGKFTMAKENRIDSLTISEFSYSSYGVFTKVNSLSLDTSTGTFNVEKMTVSGDYYGDADVMSIDGYYRNVTLTPGLKMRPAAESVHLRINGLDGEYLDFTRTYDAATDTITNSYNVKGQMFLMDLLESNDIPDMMMVEMKGQGQDTKEVTVFNGQILTPGSSVTWDSERGEIITGPGLIVSGTEMTVDSGYNTIPVRTPGTVYVATVNPSTGEMMAGQMSVNGVLYNLEITGAALGVTLDANGGISYTLVPLAGYTLSKDMACTGMTIDECDGKTAKVTLTGTDISCTAIPQKYKLSIDGKEISSEVEYRSLIEGTGLDSNVIMLVDSNGDRVCIVTDGAWSFRYTYAKDIDLKTVRTTWIDTVKTAEINKVDAEGASFTVPAGVSDLQFMMSSNIRFDLHYLDEGYSIDIVAQKMEFNGHDAFLISVLCDKDPMGSTIYFPVSDTGKKLMHVDGYGRAGELEAEEVVIDGQTYLKVICDSYSIFYTETDVSPVFDSPSNNTALYIVIGVIAALAAVQLIVHCFRKH